MSKDQEIDEGRRKFLLGSTVAVGAIGVATAAVPFVGALLPSEAAKAAGAPVKVDISELKPGEQKTVIWRGKPIWIVRRNKEMLHSLGEDAELLRDPKSEEEQQPKYAQNEYRSRRPDILVLVGLCTHLGCVPSYRPEKGAVTTQWPGGFYCTCHGSKFDLAGRVFKGVPAPINMEVPPYKFLSDNEILIGSDKADIA